MINSFQTFLVSAVQKAAADFEAAVLRIPEDRRTWKPAEGSRTVLDQAAEVAILLGYGADLIASRRWVMGSDFTAYENEKAALATDWAGIKTLLDANLPRFIAAVEGVSNAELSLPIEMPWQTMVLAQCMAHSYWNMGYHEGQVNYIASMLPPA